ncbi:MAG: hypothetical protein J6X60_12070 [Ruminiclostridium sp.]|nr:hypothetical protein [Ruminiclostridium sp.]
MKDSPKTDLTARLEDMCELAGKRGRPVFSLFFNDREQYDAMTFLKGRNDVFRSSGAETALVRGKCSG